MKLKNLNPLAGLSQIVSGYFSIPRVLPMELLLEKKVSPTLLGYSLICLVIADWDKSLLRFGFIRHDIEELANVLGIAQSTLYENLKKLEAVGFLIYEEDTYKITDFHYYTLRGAQEIAKIPLTSEKLLALFPFLRNDSEKLDSVLSKKQADFRISSNSFSESCLTKEVIEKRNVLIKKLSTTERHI